MKDDTGDLVADCRSILGRWRKYFSQPLNVHGVNDVRQTEIHTAEPLVPEPSASEFELAIIGDHQCGFLRNRSTIDHIFCIRQILEKK